MEHIVNLHIEKLPEGVYLATSEVDRTSAIETEDAGHGISR